MGRVLILDDFINIDDQSMEEPYTLDMCRHVGYNSGGKTFAHVLIIGGGDCLIANYLCLRFPNILRITMCEIDRRVVDNVQKWFGKFDSWVLEENIKKRRLDIVY